MTITIWFSSWGRGLTYNTVSNHEVLVIESDLCGLHFIKGLKSKSTNGTFFQNGAIFMVTHLCNYGGGI